MGVVFYYLWMTGLACLGAGYLGKSAFRAWLVFKIGKSEIKLQDARDALSEIGFNFIARAAIVNGSPLAKQERKNGH